MLTALYIGAFVAAAVMLGAAGLLIRDASNGRHVRVAASSAACRCGHLVISHEAHADHNACDLCTCASFRRGRPQNVSSTAMDWLA